jgi:poly(3-hydroxybutyrate) depolymerase
MAQRFLSTLFVFLGLYFYVQAQSPCGDRFKLQVFPSIHSETNVQYGQAVGYNGNNTLLYADIYMPANDSVGARPLVVLLHGGFFLFGNKNDAYQVELCTQLAKRGYVAVSISYRLGANLVAQDVSAEFSAAAIRAVQDAKAAIRFFRNNAQTVNQWNIDPDQIFLGGYSAGAVAAVHAAFLTQFPSSQPWLDALITDLGGIEGNSGTPGISSSFNAVVSLSGAILDTSLMQPGGMPIVSIHGTADDVVPFDTGTVRLLGMDIIDLQGSNYVHQKAQLLGYDSRLWAIPGADHYPQDISTAIRDSMISYVAYFLYDYVDCSALSVEEMAWTTTIYPNPGNGVLHLRSERAMEKVWMTDALGRTVFEDRPNAHEHSLQLMLESGVYSIWISAGTQLRTERVIIQR